MYSYYATTQRKHLAFQTELARILDDNRSFNHSRLHLRFTQLVPGFADEQVQCISEYQITNRDLFIHWVMQTFIVIFDQDYTGTLSLPMIHDMDDFETVLSQLLRDDNIHTVNHHALHHYGVKWLNVKPIRLRAAGSHQVKEIESGRDLK